MDEVPAQSFEFAFHSSLERIITMIAPYVVDPAYLIRALYRSATGHSEPTFRETAPLTDLTRREEFRDRFQRLAFSSDEVRLLARSPCSRRLRTGVLSPPQ